jgi:DNA-binding MarR family transcriptional regulator
VDLDKIIHEPNRLRILMVLSGLDAADFNFLLTTLSLTRGNLSRHIEKLEAAGYLEVKKSFKGKIPNTSYHLTSKGAKALTEYWDSIDAVRQLGKSN